MARSRSRERNRTRYSSSDDSDRDRYKRDRKKKRRRSSSRHSRSSSRSERQSDRDRRSRRGRERSRTRSRSKSPSRPRRRQEKAEKRDEKKHERKEQPSSLLKERVAQLVAASAASSEVLPQINNRPSSEDLAKIESQGFKQENFISTAKNSNSSGNHKEKISVELVTDSHENAIFGSSNGSNVNSQSTLHNRSNGSYHDSNEDDLFGPIFCVDQNIRTQRWLDKLRMIRQRVSQQSH